MLLNVADRNGPGTARGVAVADLGATVAPWYPGATPEVAAALQRLQSLADAGRWEAVDEYAVFLGLDIQIVN